MVSFQLDRVQRTDQDLYRCVTQSPRGSGVSNFAELVVKGNRRLFSSFYRSPSPFFRPPRSPHHQPFFSPLIFITTRFSCLSSATLRNQMTRMKLIAACGNRPPCETQMMSAPAKIVRARSRNSHTCFLFQIDFHETQIVWCLTHINGFWTPNVGTRACCFFPFKAAVVKRSLILSFSALSKSCSLDLDSCSPLSYHVPQMVTSLPITQSSRAA